RPWGGRAGRGPAAAAAPAGKGLSEDVLEGFEKAPALETIAPEVPPSLCRLIDAMLEPERADRPPSAEWVAIRLEQIKSEIAGLSRALPPEEVGPFRGLGRFEDRAGEGYCGGGRERAAVVEARRGRGRGAISGAPGGGKSGPARAGVLPAVAGGVLGGWPKQWDTTVTEPGQDPRASLSLALAPFVNDAAELQPSAIVLALADRAQREGRGVLLLVDQLDELVTL